MVEVGKSTSVGRALGPTRRMWFLGILLALAITETPAQGEDAVVKVVATVAGKSYEGIGFVYQPSNSQKTYVVTALHVVAGSTKIEIQSAGEQKLADARIFKFLRKADLVLLEPQPSLRVTPLAIHTGAVPSTAKIWSISEQRVDANDMRLGKEKPLFDLFKRERSAQHAKSLPPLTAEEINKHFDPHYYPDSRAPVIELDKPIGPGDSGSPITYNDAAISMVNGGLHNLGGIKKAWWSIPLKRNLDLLLTQGETDATKIKPYAGAGGRILFSKPRGDNKAVNYTKGDPSSAPFSLYHTAQVSFVDAYETMLPEDREFIEEVLSDDKRITVNELSSHTLDVFECYTTGATFAVPTMLSGNLEIDQDAGHTFVEAYSQFSEHGRSFVKLIVFIDPNGLQAKNDFKQYLLSGEALDNDDWGGEDLHAVQWVKDTNPADDVIDHLHDPSEPYYRETMERVYEREGQDGELYSVMTINKNGTFLGVAIIVNDPSSLSGNDLINYYLIETCVTMAGFPYD